MTLALLTALALPSAAQAEAQKPTVATKTASNVGSTTALLNGAVNARGAETTYFFQIGLNSTYDVKTPATPVGHGTKAVQVSFPYTGLLPAKTYHYRIVAVNAKGLTKGKDRTFKTHRQPLGLVLNPAANPIPFNASTTLVGQLTGTGSGGQQVLLQANPFPYPGFANVGNALVTNPDGTFSFPLLNVGLNTQYRVLMPEKPAVVSPVVSLGVKVAVHTRAKPRRPRSGRRVRFSGTIAPAATGSPVFVQKSVDGEWVTVARATARALGTSSSSFRRRVKVRHSGTYRVLVEVADGAHVANNGRSIHIRVRHR